MIYIGIDPGLGGAVAAIDGTNVKLYDAPTAIVKGTKRDYIVHEMATILRNLVPYEEDAAHIVIEAVHSMPKQGVASSFSFGRGLGLWEGVAAGLGIPYTKVAPQTWKKAMMPDMNRENKDSSRIIATRLFPNAVDMLSRKKDEGRAEALLMAEYGKRFLKV